MENEEITQQQTASQPPGPQSYTYIDYRNSTYNIVSNLNQVKVAQ